tara:strand:+ start:633 stop:1472 length:840 start_codon:yes stop_codon:yes gene_type:complete
MVQMTNFVALRNGGRGAPTPSFRAKKTRPAFLSDLGSDRSEVPAKREATREMFFKGDKSISDDRLDNRYTQFAEYEKFKNDPTKTKLVEGTTNLFQAATPGGMTLADKANQLAMKFGPKPSEIMSDIGKGVGNFMGAVAERGTPMMQFLKAMGSGIQNFFSPNTMQVPTAVGTPFQTMNFDQIAQTAQLFDKARENKTDGRINMSDINNVITELDPMGGMTLNNLTPFGEQMKNRLLNDRPGITDDQLLNSLRRIDRAGFAGSGKPIFFLANGGIATLQ